MFSKLAQSIIKAMF
ncbi:hypothetical protein U9258_22470 [Escherichia coli]